MSFWFSSHLVLQACAAAWTFVAAVSNASSASCCATASASGLSLLCWYQSPPFVYCRPKSSRSLAAVTRFRFFS